MSLNITHYWPQITATILSIIASLIVWRIKRDKLKLHYFVTETESFDSANYYIKYYTVKIANAGNKLIEQITIDISFSEGVITRITDDKLIQQLNQTNNTVSFSVDHLNPKENLCCTVTIQESKKGTSKPTILVRGKGSTAIDRTLSQGKSNKTVEFSAVGFLLGFIGFMALDIASDPAEATKPDRIENVFIILNKSELSHLFPAIIESHDDLSYAGTAFYVTHCYLQDSTKLDRYTNALKLISQVGDISDNSKGVAYYLLYKIYSREKKTAEANEYLNKCKNECDCIYQELLAQDQYYNLDNLFISKSRY